MQIQSERVVGVTFEGRQEIIRKMNELTNILFALREPDNPYDSNAIGVYTKDHRGKKKSVGYIRKEKATELAPQLDAGKTLDILNYHIVGSGANGHSLGILFEYILR